MRNSLKGCVECSNAEYKWCKPCQIKHLKGNFANWTSQIDKLIQEMQLNIDEYNDTIFEWIPYYQFDDIKELINETHLAKWKDVGSQNITYKFLNEIIANYNKVEVYVKSYAMQHIYSARCSKVDDLSYNYYDVGNSGNAVILKYLVNPQNITYEFLDEIEINYNKVKVYGISQDPDTKYYIIIFNKDHKELLCNVTYSARWKDDLSSGYHNIGDSVILKYLVNPRNITYKLLDKIIAYYNKVEVYGISQDPDTKYYIIIFSGDQYLENCCVKCEKFYTNAKRKWCKPCQINWLKENFTNWASENKQINNIIQEVQLKINDYNDIIFEWIPYYQIVDIEKLSNTTYLAKWKDGPLCWNEKAYTRNLENKVIILKYLIITQNITNELLDEVCKQFIIN
uniref:Uncharacterized protein n=1 Tax=Rhizophagus irregularis (strain DAOM 181602 / DAOM 197198 / MUCL 43194) TaxID=747089 RepID=U9TL46_RHIID